MTRKELLVALALLVLTVLSLSFAPASLAPGGADAESPAAPTTAATAAATATVTPRPGHTPAPASATPSVTLRATATSSPTRTVTSSPTRTLAPTATGTPTVPASVEPTAVPEETSEPTPSETATATPPPTASPTEAATPDGAASPEPTLPSTFAFDTRPDLDRYIYIDQRAQHMYVFEWGELVRDIPCSTGLPNDDTYTEAWEGQVGAYWGSFLSFGVYADDAWYLYPSLGSILIHSLPYTWQNGYKVYQDRDALGVRPASHGCIRIAPEDCQWLNAWGPEGAWCTVTDPELAYWRERLGIDS